MAFESVARTSPIVAAGSAVALSLFHVVGAHLLGGTLRQAAAYVPDWCRHAAMLLALSGFLVGIVAVTWDLRMKGLDLEIVDVTEPQSSIFGLVPRLCGSCAGVYRADRKDRHLEFSHLVVGSRACHTDLSVRGTPHLETTE